MLSIIFSADQFSQLNINVIYANHGKNIWKYVNQKANISFGLKKIKSLKVIKNKTFKLIREIKKYSI